MTAARKITVTGTVQGVGFRWTAKRIAMAVGVAGWVRNNPDGSVTVALEGTDMEMDAFIDRLAEAMGGYMDCFDAKAAVPEGLVDFSIVR